MIIRTYDLKLKHVFTISRQSYDHKPTMIVELTDGKLSGFGEASENPYYHKTVQGMVQDLIKIRNVVETDQNLTPEAYWNKVYPYLKNDMFALCAVDIAYNDLYARKAGKKLYELWSYSLDHIPMSNYTIGIDTVENMLAKMKEVPWPIYKIKLGTKEDIKIVKELRKHSDAVFRIDANCAWGVDETISNAKALKALGVEFLEQPLPAEDWEGAREVFKKSVLPVIADESCQVEDDVDRCKDHFHGINIKLVKCGGLTPARRMLAKANKYGMKKMVGCMTESSVGMSAIAQLLPELDYVDMDGTMLLAYDIADGVKMEYGKIKFPDRNGTGVKLLEYKPKTEIK